MSRRDLALNMALAVGSAFFTYVASEIVVARVLLDRTPLNRQELLSEELRVLAQSSKRGIVPRSWSRRRAMPSRKRSRRSARSAGWRSWTRGPR